MKNCLYFVLLVVERYEEQILLEFRRESDMFVIRILILVMNVLFLLVKIKDEFSEELGL